MKNWLAPTRKNREREAYLKTFSSCQQTCKRNDMNPSKMLEELSAFKDNLESQPKPWALSLDNWLYETNRYRVMAVVDCIDIVHAVNRYLP